MKRGAEYEELKQYLPEISQERMERIGEIVQIHVRWDVWMMRKKNTDNKK